MFLTTIWHILSRSDAMRNRPLKGLLQITKGIIAGLATIVIVSLLINKSPMNLITGRFRRKTHHAFVYHRYEWDTFLYS